MLFAFITIFIGILSCSKSPKNQTAGFLLQTDRDFSALSVKQGMHKAFLYYISDDGSGKFILDTGSQGLSETAE
jgi:hypothetical protein